MPILNLQRQSILGGFDLLALALTPKGKPSSLKDYNNLNKVDINNILSLSRDHPMTPRIRLPVSTISASILTT